MQTNFDDISPEKRAYLEAEVLHLPRPILSCGDEYFQALRDHAMPIVEMLVQIQDAGVQRKEPALAEYNSDRGGHDLLYSRAYNRDVAIAIIDLAKAARLRVAIVDWGNNSNFQLPKQFKTAFDRLDLPPALKQRIDGRRAAIIEELDRDIEKMNRVKEGGVLEDLKDLKDFVMSLFRGTSAASPPPKARFESDYILKISYDFNPKSASQDYQRDTYSYNELEHRVSIVPQDDVS